jgi:hypothetical protein
VESCYHGYPTVKTMKPQDMMQKIVALSAEASQASSAKKKEIAEQIAKLMTQEKEAFELMAVAAKFGEMVERVGLPNAQDAVMRFSKENDHIKNSVEEFFQTKDLFFETKESGVSRGIKAIVGDKKFHIKCHDSHSKGHIDPREIFVYKVLELSGFGSKVYAIPGVKQTSVDGYYIATQDMSYSKDPSKKKEFTVYSEEGEDDKTFDKTFKENSNFRQEVMALEILCNCLSLRDTFENPGNFGTTCVKSEDGQVSYKPKLVDFKNTGTSYSKEETEEKSRNSFVNKEWAETTIESISHDYPKAILYLLKGRKGTEKDMESIFAEAKKFVFELRSSGPRSFSEPFLPLRRYKIAFG